MTEPSCHHVGGVTLDAPGVPRLPAGPADANRWDPALSSLRTSVQQAGDIGDAVLTRGDLALPQDVREGEVGR